MPTMRAPMTRCYRVNCDKIRSVLPEYQPLWDARKGAEELYQAYLGSGLTLEEFEGPRYQRIGHIRKLIAEGVLNSSLRRVRRTSRAEHENETIQRERRD